MIKYVIFLGKPGSGKGTQAQRFVERGWAWLSTGELMRQHIRNQTDLGKQVSHYVQSGALVPDEITFALVSDFLKGLSDEARVVMDGFPRNKNQAQLLEEWSTRNGAELILAIEFCLSDDEALRRLLNRYMCPVCGFIGNAPGRCPKDGAELVRRVDDDEAVIMRRIQDYGNYISQLRAYYQRLGKYMAVNGMASPDTITKQLDKVMGVGLR